MAVVLCKLHSTLQAAMHFVTERYSNAVNGIATSAISRWSCLPRTITAYLMEARRGYVAKTEEAHRVVRFDL